MMYDKPKMTGGLGKYVNAAGKSDMVQRPLVPPVKATPAPRMPAAPRATMNNLTAAPKKADFAGRVGKIAALAAKMGTRNGRA